MRGTAREGAIPASRDITRTILTRPAGEAAGAAAWLFGACRRALLDTRTAIAALAVLLGTRIYAQLGGLINHDTAWYLHAAGQWLEGGRLYRDIFVDVNPPLGLYLTAPPVALARLTGLAAVDLFVLYLYALIGLSLAAVWGLLRGWPDLSTPSRRGLVFAAALALTVAPAGEFGQREHFLLVLTLPYLILTALRAAGARCPWPLAAAVGVAAALGFALKPHFLLVPLALEVYLLAAGLMGSGGRKSGLLRPETLALGATGAVYAAALVVFTPDYLARIVPYAVEIYNSAYRSPARLTLWRAETVLLPFVGLAHVTTRRGQVRPVFCDVFLIASACLLLAYAVQMKGWAYQLYPASACLLLGLAALFLDGLETRPETGPGTAPPRPGPGVTLTALAAALLLVGTSAGRGGYRNDFLGTMMPHVTRHAAGGSIAVFTTNVSVSFPLVTYAGVGWSSRLSAQWLLPGAARKRQTDGGAANPLLDEIEGYARDLVVADLTRRPPDLVIVDKRERKSYFGGLAFDYIDYFSADPRFAAIWAGYQWIGDEGDYRLYRRGCPSGC